MKANIIICCNQIDCKYNKSRWVYQNPSHNNSSLYNNVCVHPNPDIYDKNESKNKTISDRDAYRSRCESKEIVNKK